MKAKQNRNRLPLASSLTWLQRNLFSSPLNTALTIVALAVMYFVFVPIFRWLIVDAYWIGTEPDACPIKTAACWPFIWARFDQLIYGLYPADQRWRINVGVALGILLALPAFIPRFPKKRWLIPLLLAAYPMIAIFLFLGGKFGLPHIATSQWGGFFLTIITAVFVLATSLPTGILLALGRRSSIPLLRIVCTTWIEFWRSVPALMVLFVAIIMFPLFMPADVEVDKLLRALIALSILMSSYLAEVMRGAMQSIPEGQNEAAEALGLGYWPRTFLVILPQAMPVAMPQITSNFIGLFKETTVLLIVGLFDLLGMVQSAASDPAWLSQGVSATGYFFTALFFWMFCFTFSRYSLRLEKKMGAYRTQQGA